MRSFSDYKDYILANTNHAKDNERKEVHIILHYPLLPFSDFYKYLMTLTWYTGMRRFDKNTDEQNSIIFAETLEEACAQADNFDYALVSYIGTVYRLPSRPEPDIWTYFDEWKNIADESPCKGHILWHPFRQYGRMHLQSMFLNLKHWRSINRPSFGKWTGDVSVPTVCEQNIHDDYTPLWLKPGAETSSVIGAEMAEYISAVIKDGKKIINFTSDERNLKYFTYPQRDELSPPLKKDQEQFTNILYRKNTTNYTGLQKYVDRYKGPKYDVIYAPASGGVGEYLWSKLGHKNTKLIFLDNNLASIVWKKSLHGYFGNRVENLRDLNQITQIVGNRYNCYIDEADYKEQSFHTDGDNIWSDEQWISTLGNIDYDAKEFNFITDTLEVDGTKRNFIYLTNIFSYVFNYFKYSLEDMDKKFQELLRLPNCTIAGSTPFRGRIIHTNHE